MLNPMKPEDLEVASWLAAALRAGVRDIERSSALRAPAAVRLHIESLEALVALGKAASRTGHDRSRQATTSVDEIDRPADDAGVKKLVTAKEAGRRLGVSARTVDRLRVAGQLPSVKVSGARRYHVDAVDAFAATRDHEDHPR